MTEFYFLGQSPIIMSATVLRIYSILLLFSIVCYAWPDGAPCIHAVFESMNPLEAVEHQGGLQVITYRF